MSEAVAEDGAEVEKGDRDGQEDRTFDNDQGHNEIVDRCSCY